MNFNDYQSYCTKFANWTGKGASNLGGLPPAVYCALGLAGEAGELLDKIKKIYRDKEGEITAADLQGLILEGGDTLWYLSQLFQMLGVQFSRVALDNIVKLEDRRERGVIGGSGDNR